MTKNKKSRGPHVQMAPEFSGNGLAAALGNKNDVAMTQPAADVAVAAEPEWTVFGVDIVAQMAAENAARAANQTLGAWLSDLIVETAAEKK